MLGFFDVARPSKITVSSSRPAFLRSPAGLLQERLQPAGARRDVRALREEKQSFRDPRGMTAGLDCRRAAEKRETMLNERILWEPHSSALADQQEEHRESGRGRGAGGGGGGGGV